MKRFICVLACIIAVVAACSMVLAAEYWVMLGQRTVTDRIDHDVIYVTAADGEFSALKIAVFRRPVEFKDVKVSFANGEVQDIQIRRVINPGEETRIIDLSGDKRVINRIEFWYDVQSILGRRAVVRVYGLKVGGGR